MASWIICNICYNIIFIYQSFPVVVLIINSQTNHSNYRFFIIIIHFYFQCLIIFFNQHFFMISYLPFILFLQFLNKLLKSIMLPLLNETCYPKRRRIVTINSNHNKLLTFKCFFFIFIQRKKYTSYRNRTQITIINK